MSIDLRTTTKTIIPILFLLVAAVAMAESRNFGFERGSLGYQQITVAVSPRIEQPITPKGKAILLIKLLSDYESAARILKSRLESLKNSKASSELANTQRLLSLCCAHLGEIDQAQRWLEEAEAAKPNSYSYKRGKEEIERCRRWLPVLQRRSRPANPHHPVKIIVKKWSIFTWNWMNTVMRWD